MHAFGGPVHLFAGDADDGTSLMVAHEDMDHVRRTLLGFSDGGQGFLRIYRPQPTAAFSPRDTTLANYAAAAEAMREFGFEPVERRAGGQLAVYDSSALVIDLVAPHDEPRLHVLERYRQFSRALVSAFAALSVDGRIGALDGEYCPGEYSVNGAGRIKLTGVAQRIGRQGFHLGAVISVMPSAQAMTAVASAYRILEIPFDPSTFGAVTDLRPGLSFDEVRDALFDSLSRILNIRPPPITHALAGR